MSSYGYDASVQDVTLTADGAIAEYVAVVQDGSEQATAAGAGVAILGFAKAAGSIAMPAAAGEKVTVGVGGTQLARAGAAIATPGPVEVDASGYVIPLAAGVSVGWCLNTAATDDIVAVIIR